jgi:hypothetical protein
VHIRVAFVTAATLALAFGAGSSAGLASADADGPQVDAPIWSPDERRSATLVHRGAYGRIVVALKGGAGKTLYASNDSCCHGIAWASSRLLVFDDDYNVKTLDVTTGRIVRIAGFSDFVVSQDGKFVAGWADSGGHKAERVGVVPIAGGSCSLVPARPNQDDTKPTFSADGTHLAVLRRSFDPAGGGVDPRGRRVVVSLAALRARPANAC